ncbi:MAG: hypothetical protein AAF219_10385, partial [Myxococcota bacterium]
HEEKMLRTLITTIVLMAMAPWSARAETVGFPDVDNFYHPQEDVNEYVVFAQATWRMLWNYRDRPDEERWTYVSVNGERYNTAREFYSSSWETPGSGSLPSAKLFVGPANKCVVSFRPSLEGEQYVEGLDALAVNLEYPIWGVITAFWANVEWPYRTATDTYYYNLLQQMAPAIDAEARNQGCGDLVSVGYSMGASFAQLYAYRAWVGRGSFPVNAVYAFNPGPTGNGVFRHSYNNLVKKDGRESHVFCRHSDPIRTLSEGAYWDPVSKNWELGCTSVGVAIDGAYNADGPPVNHDLRGWRTCGDILNHDDQCPTGDPSASDWAQTNGSRGTEGAYLGNFVFTTQDHEPKDYKCVNPTGQLATKNDDNHFCSWQAIDMEWSKQGPIAGKDCINITETADHDWGDNNYLCIQKGSGYSLSWYTNGQKPGQNCVQWYEPNATSWRDNYLCWTTDNDTLVSDNK